MATFEVDFIFCCPCFVTSVFDLRFYNLRKNFEFSHFIHRRNRREAFDIDNFPGERTMFVSCFMHLSDEMVLDSLECLHYNGGRVLSSSFG